MGRSVLHQFARGPDGRIIDAQETKRGSKGYTALPPCSGEMVWRQGEERAYHFAHKAASDCCGESELHRAAKETIAERLREHLHGKAYPVFLKCPRSNDCPLMAYQLEPFSYVEIERDIFGKTPDVTIFDSNFNPVVAIEVIVSNKPDPEKVELLNRNRVRVLPLTLTRDLDSVRALRESLTFVPPPKTPHHRIHLPSQGITWSPMAGKIGPRLEEKPAEPFVASLDSASIRPDEEVAAGPNAVDRPKEVNVFSPDEVTPGVSAYEGIGGVGRTRSEEEREPDVWPIGGSGIDISPIVEFKEMITATGAKNRPLLQRLLGWAEELKVMKCVRLTINRGLISTVKLSLLDEDASLCAIYAGHDARMTLHAGVLRRRARPYVPLIERLIAPKALSQTTSVTAVSDELLGVLGSAYVAASGKQRAADRRYPSNSQHLQSEGDAGTETRPQQFVEGTEPVQTENDSDGAPDATNAPNPSGAYFGRT